MMVKKQENEKCKTCLYSDFGISDTREPYCSDCSHAGPRTEDNYLPDPTKIIGEP
jgi:hypothetical protein